ncbi:MAG: hypothetical protein C4532_20100 [Candidatus Abyssobacteria bacterium SURF_17]|uniref:Uncharacterized protein n=1 Tax=Candidatus Abyssobacteria bacterium SURF_17 TaxID=2093361 RepID=A0A419EMS0_9BACT|nr:MAG: hypothetical protein C4532_20100 [Candidatus Abyssubacteria bacterium SURF_17]
MEFFIENVLLIRLLLFALASEDSSLGGLTTQSLVPNYGIGLPNRQETVLVAFSEMSERYLTGDTIPFSPFDRRMTKQTICISRDIFVLACKKCIMPTE